MKTISPLKGLMNAIRTLKKPMTEAANEAAWCIPMWNDPEPMVCPVPHASFYQASKNGSLDQRR